MRRRRMESRPVTAIGGQPRHKEPLLAPHLPSLQRAATEDARAGVSCNGCDGERWLARMRQSGMVCSSLYLSSDRSGRRSRQAAGCNRLECGCEGPCSGARGAGDVACKSRRKVTSLSPYHNLICAGFATPRDSDLTRLPLPLSVRSGEAGDHRRRCLNRPKPKIYDREDKDPSHS
ncbi:unnamed protein product [Urochloa humidicola]